jgi:hypothetical protein
MAEYNICPICGDEISVHGIKPILEVAMGYHTERSILMKYIE